jgi:hypothetical protein
MASLLCEAEQIARLPKWKPAATGEFVLARVFAVRKLHPIEEQEIGALKKDSRSASMVARSGSRFD